ncbi:hypothetical protein GCM10023156_30650 [Novipirellula rosea]|uniref:Uncharacterized protein n=1 Tax=Novipirellula rosea TaxID=1031540 RepID=A0ABP8MV69_9BACT
MFKASSESDSVAYTKGIDLGLQLCTQWTLPDQVEPHCTVAVNRSNGIDQCFPAFLCRKSPEAANFKIACRRSGTLGGSSRIGGDGRWC